MRVNSHSYAHTQTSGTTTESREYKKCDKYTFDIVVSPIYKLY